MKLIADLYKPDLVLMPIGGNFTLGPKEAAWAIKEWLHPKWMIPMHYGANPLAKGTPEELIKELGSSTTQVMVPKPGDELVF
jgi:L-ascorbate metabolism protein UlaG (beta-lactamase superfamily)